MKSLTLVQATNGAFIAGSSETLVVAARMVTFGEYATDGTASTVKARDWEKVAIKYNPPKDMYEIRYLGVTSFVGSVKKGRSKAKWWGCRFASDKGMDFGYSTKKAAIRSAVERTERYRKMGLI